MLQSIFTLFQTGLSSPDSALLVARISVGVFFAISGFNKLFNPGRHKSLTANLTKNGIPYIPVMQWFVPFWEFVSGLFLAIGLFTVFHALVLMIICVVAACCEARKRVAAYSPINAGDVVADYLYLQEILYMVLLSVNILAGGGKFSFDHIVFKF